MVFSFCSRGDRGAREEGFRPDFDRDLRIDAHVVEPVGMRRRAAFGGDHDQASVVCRVGEGSDPQLTRLGADGGQEQEGRTGEHAANLSPIGAELLD